MNTGKDSTDPDSFESLCTKWRFGIECSDELVAKMWTNVSKQIDELTFDHEEQSDKFFVENALPRSQWRTGDGTKIGRLSAVAAGVLILVSIAVYRFTRTGHTSVSDNESSIGESQQQHSSGDSILKPSSLQRLAFTAEDLVESQMLACEYSRICNKPVIVRRKLSSWVVDDADFSSVDSSFRSSKLLFRCVLLELDYSSAEMSWREVDREEVIAFHDQPLELLSERESTLQAWTHLLPDKALWAVIRDGSTVQEQLLRENEPFVFRENSENNSFRRLVMIYKLLDSCDEESLL